MPAAPPPVGWLGEPGSTAIVTEPGRVGEPLLHTRPARPGGIVSRTRRCHAGPRKGRTVARIIVEVMLKPEIHDPQGEAILRASQRLGFGEVLGVRQGKRFEVELAGTADGRLLARVGELAGELLANPVIEEFTFREA
jgi:phosphoribosylformylglycinamidine synthase subunit PurS